MDTSARKSVERRSSTLGRLLLVAAGGVLGFALLEGVLQLCRLRLGEAGLPPPVPIAHPDKISLLCIGDSHTYGLAVQRELESYPVRLEVRLNAGNPDGPFRVENLGVPGTNTALVGDQARRALQAARWSVLLVLAGYNDEWNLQEPAAPGTVRARPHLLTPQFLRWLWFCLRPSGLTTDQVGQDETGLYILHADGTRDPVNADEQSTPGRFTGSALAERVDRGLLQIVDHGKRAGVPVLLQTYACRYNDRFLAASAGARITAQRLGASLVDHAQWFEQNAADVASNLLFQPDGHETGAGYERMARAIHERLLALKVQGQEPFASWPLPALDGVQAGTPDWRVSTSPVEMKFHALPTHTRGIVRFSVIGPADRTFRLMFSRARDPQAPSLLALTRDDWFEASRTADGLGGRFDAKGESEAWVALRIFGGSPPHSVMGQLLALDPYAGDPAHLLVGASAAVELDLAQLARE